MADSRQNRFRIFLDIWLARIGSLFGWVLLVFWLVPGVYGLFEILLGKAESTADLAMPWICFGLAFLHYLVIRSARKTKALIADFRLYCAVFAHSPEKSIPDLAETLNVPKEEAMKRLKEMCRRGYFNGYIDYSRQQMRFASSPAPKGAAENQPKTVVYCPGCGARNAIVHSGDTCQYCESPLNL